MEPVKSGAYSRQHLEELLDEERAKNDHLRKELKNAWLAVGAEMGMKCRARAQRDRMAHELNEVKKRLPRLA